MTFLHFVRRAHLYTGLVLMPWVVMFGLSTIPLNHQAGPEQATWIAIGEYHLAEAVPAAGENLRPLGRRIMQAAGVEGGYFVNRVNARQVNVNHPRFLGPIRLIYHADTQRIIAERRQQTLRSFMSGLHTRGGYDLDGFWDSMWAVFVDVVSVALILWIASGIYMWWHLPATRTWGWIALGAGAACFITIVSRL